LVFLMSIDDVDIAILRLLQKNCRLPLQEIAKHVGKSPGTVNYRIKRLFSLGVLKNCIAVIDREKLGFEYNVIIMVRIKPNMLGKLEEFLGERREVLMAYAVTGHYDICMVAVFRNEKHYLEFMETLHGTGYVTETTTFVVVKRIKESLEAPI